MPSDFAVGDVVRHRLLAREKVIVGIRENRCLCASREDILEDGRLRPNARVVLHHQESLEKIGSLGKITPVHFDRLYDHDPKQVLRKRYFSKEQLLLYALLIVTITPVSFLLLTGIESARSHIEIGFFRMAIEHRLASKEREEEKREEKGKEKPGQDHEETETKQLKQRYLKKEVNEKEIKGLKERYLAQDISDEQLKQLGTQYLSGQMTPQEKEALKQRYLKPGIGKQEIDSVKRRYLRQ